MVPAMTIQEDVVSFVELQVAIGRLDPDEIVEEAVDYLADEAPPDKIEAFATNAVTAVLAGHLAAQSSWPAVTDNDRLTAAFTVLDAAGIVAREDFACCQNCGVTEIGGEVSESAVGVRGYAFYHQQDTDDAVEHGSLHLAYGPFNAEPQPGTDPIVEVGREVADTLRAQGLTVIWDGTAAQRILVRINWQKRRA
jgi:hypothetical protein